MCVSHRMENGWIDMFMEETVKFKEVILTYVGVRGIVPEGWTQIGDGQFRRAASETDPTMLFERAFAHVDGAVVKDVLAREIGLDAFPERVGALEIGARTWDLYNFDHEVPYLGALRSDFALAQDGTWTYLVSLSTRPDDSDDLYSAVFIPILEAFTPLHRQVGRLAGGAPDPSEGPTLAQRLGYSADRILVIVHTDDIGYHRDQTDGVMQLAKKYNLCMLPVDIAKMRSMSYVFPDSFWQFASNMIGEDKDPSIRKKVYDDWLRNLEPGVHQVMTHIANVTEDYASKVPNAHFRHADYVYWTSPETQALAEALDITFIGYRELQLLQATNWEHESERVR